MAQELMQMATSHGACGDGTSAATAVAVNIDVGFRPKYVKVVAIDTNCKETYWVSGMDAAKGVYGVEDTGFKLREHAANGITVNARGFTIGTAAQINSRKYFWVALG